jgi:toxin ParE1/3/4
MKPLVRRAIADADVLAALDYYVLNAPEYALAFVDSLQQAYQHIQRHPASGSPRYAHELNLPELRVWGCRQFPYLVFYVEHPSQIEVWRVLHGNQDIPASLQWDTLNKGKE